MKIIGTSSIPLIYIDQVMKLKLLLRTPLHSSVKTIFPILPVKRTSHIFIHISCSKTISFNGFTHAYMCYTWMISISPFPNLKYNFPSHFFFISQPPKFLNNFLSCWNCCMYAHKKSLYFEHFPKIEHVERKFLTCNANSQTFQAWWALLLYYISI